MLPDIEQGVEFVSRPLLGSFAKHFDFWCRAVHPGDVDLASALRGEKLATVDASDVRFLTRLLHKHKFPVGGLSVTAKADVIVTRINA
jgi:hypothetical protein